MKNRMTRMLSRSIRTFVALLCAVTPWLSLPAQAQTTVPSLTVNSCDGQAFPTITCIVTALDRNGLPAQGLTASSFEVLDSNKPVAGATVTQNVNSGVTTSILFLLDLSASLKGAGTQTVKDIINQSLDDIAKDSARANDLVAMIVLNSNKVDIGADPNKPPINPETEVPFTIDKVLPRNTLKPLSPSGATPLYDGVRKALLLTAQQPLGRRAIIAISDGFDSKSSGFTIDSDITMAQHEIIPIYTLKIGQKADNAKLQRLAFDTGGEVISPGAAGDVSAAIMKIQDRLKTQYVISFKSAAAGFNPDITFRWKTPAGNVEQQVTTIDKLPVAPPKLEGFKINGEAGDLNSTPLKGDVSLEPVLQGPAPLQVQYDLDGNVKAVKQAPFTYQFSADNLNPGSQLVVTLFSTTGVTSTTSFNLVKEAPPPTPVPTPTTPASPLSTLAANPTLLIAIAVAVVGLIILVALVITLLSRRRHAAPIYPVSTDAAFSPATSIQQELPTAMFQSPDSGKTQVMDRTSVMGADEGVKTQVWQVGKAKLEITSGTRKGDIVMIGMAGLDIQLGREVEDGPGSIRLPSVHVSRHHAVIKMEGDQMTLTDLSSTSGTQVNGAKLAANISTPIKVGDKIEFADISATVIEP
ncbi:MAG: FHA domain-containing protein [Chloroflexi bacterium]|nr:FHA domain-containing protein [Chloroflexota bacterium]MCL5275595.1 FHA domain-containing protein [Chloroflexota bacterium]